MLAYELDSMYDEFTCKCLVEVVCANLDKDFDEDGVVFRFMYKEGSIAQISRSMYVLLKESSMPEIRGAILKEELAYIDPKTGERIEDDDYMPGLEFMRLFMISKYCWGLLPGYKDTNNIQSTMQPAEYAEIVNEIIDAAMLKQKALLINDNVFTLYARTPNLRKGLRTRFFNAKSPDNRNLASDNPGILSLLENDFCEYCRNPINWDIISDEELVVEDFLASRMSYFFPDWINDKLSGYIEGNQQILFGGEQLSIEDTKEIEIKQRTNLDISKLLYNIYKMDEIMFRKNTKFADETALQYSSIEWLSSEITKDKLNLINSAYDRYVKHNYGRMRNAISAKKDKRAVFKFRTDYGVKRKTYEDFKSKISKNLALLRTFYDKSTNLNVENYLSEMILAINNLREAGLYINGHADSSNAVWFREPLHYDTAESMVVTTEGSKLYKTLQGYGMKYNVFIKNEGIERAKVLLSGIESLKQIQEILEEYGLSLLDLPDVTFFSDQEYLSSLHLSGVINSKLFPVSKEVINMTSDGFDVREIQLKTNFEIENLLSTLSKHGSILGERDVANVKSIQIRPMDNNCKITPHIEPLKVAIPTGIPLCRAAKVLCDSIFGNKCIDAHSWYNYSGVMQVKLDCSSIIDVMQDMKLQDIQNVVGSLVYLLFWDPEKLYIIANALGLAFEDMVEIINAAKSTLLAGGVTLVEAKRIADAKPELLNVGIDATIVCELGKYTLERIFSKRNSTKIGMSILRYDWNTGTWEDNKGAVLGKIQVETVLETLNKSAKARKQDNALLSILISMEQGSFSFTNLMSVAFKVIGLYAEQLSKTYDQRFPEDMDILQCSDVISAIRAAQEFCLGYKDTLMKNVDIPYHLMFVDGGDYSKFMKVHAATKISECQGLLSRSQSILTLMQSGVESDRLVVLSKFDRHGVRLFSNVNDLHNKGKFTGNLLDLQLKIIRTTINHNVCRNMGRIISSMKYQAKILSSEIGILKKKGVSYDNLAPIVEIYRDVIVDIKKSSEYLLIAYKAIKDSAVQTRMEEYHGFKTNDLDILIHPDGSFVGKRKQVTDEMTSYYFLLSFGVVLQINSGVLANEVKLISETAGDLFD